MLALLYLAAIHIAQECSSYCRRCYQPQFQKNVKGSVGILFGGCEFFDVEIYVINTDEARTNILETHIFFQKYKAELFNLRSGASFVLNNSACFLERL